MTNVVCSSAVRASLCHLLALVPQIQDDTKQYQVRERDSVGFYYCGRCLLFFEPLSDTSCFNIQ